MQLPAEFNLLGHVIRIECLPADKWGHGENCVGVWIPGEDRIEIVEASENAMMHALCHEMTHAVLGFQNHKLYTNEAFVDQFGGMLAQILTTLHPVKPRRKAVTKGRK